MTPTSIKLSLAILCCHCFTATLNAQEFVPLSNREITQVLENGIIASSGVWAHDPVFVRMPTKDSKVGQRVNLEVGVVDGIKNYTRANGQVIKIKRLRVATADEVNAYKRVQREKVASQRRTLADRRRAIIDFRRQQITDLQTAKVKFNKLPQRKIGRLRLANQTKSDSNVTFIGFGGPKTGQAFSKELDKRYVEFDRGASPSYFDARNHYAIPEDFGKCYVYFLSVEEKLFVVHASLLHATATKKVKKYHQEFLDVQKQTATTFALVNGILNYGKSRNSFNMPGLFVIENWSAKNVAADRFDLPAKPKEQ